MRTLENKLKLKYKSRIPYNKKKGNNKFQIKSSIKNYLNRTLGSIYYN